jgi:hypothetical protein
MKDSSRTWRRAAVPDAPRVRRPKGVQGVTPAASVLMGPSRTAGPYKHRRSAVGPREEKHDDGKQAVRSGQGPLAQHD